MELGKQMELKAALLVFAIVLLGVITRLYTDSGDGVMGWRAKEEDGPQALPGKNDRLPEEM